MGGGGFRPTAEDRYLANHALCTLHCTHCPTLFQHINGGMYHFNAKTSLKFHFKVFLPSLGPFPKCALEANCAFIAERTGLKMGDLLICKILYKHQQMLSSKERIGEVSR